MKTIKQLKAEFKAEFKTEVNDFVSMATFVAKKASFADLKAEVNDFVNMVKFVAKNARYGDMEREVNDLVIWLINGVGHGLSVVCLVSEKMRKASIYNQKGTNQ